MGRIGALDGVRALAVLLVIVHHAEIPGITGGFIGVDIFFVLSGYLITRLLWREAKTSGEIAIGRFLLRRAIRLMPAFFLLLAATLLIGPFFWPDENLGLVVAIASVYLADYASALYGDLSVLGHTWSLSVEEHFYLLWPIAVLGLARLKNPARALLVAFAAATLWRILNAWYFPDFGMTAFRFDTRASGLILGAWLAVSGLTLSAPAAERFGWLSLLSLAAFAATATELALPAALLQPAIDIAAAGLIASLTVDGTRFARAFAWRPAVLLGLISYSVYLWHYPISVAAEIYTGDWRIVLAIALSLSIAIAALSYVLVEKPLQDWRQTHRRHQQLE